ncbi:ABC transporter ATP-binding protein/permease [Streptomyces sp. NBC_01210]|uniref:ABC transporter ATP-binding protein n=1 Tax=Streptomyces sp. NBC_01210 TaxID=2903774 RepID=UPI002E14A7B1|nr:ABC transporter ATP-binding protein/permease [Streptomyces sp. NBC_01210]
MFLRETVRHGAPRAVFVLLLTCALAATGLALPAVLGRALDLLLAGRRSDAGPWLALCAGLTGLAVVLGALDGLVTGTANARTTAWIRERVLRHALASGPRLRLAPGEVVARLTGNAAQAGTVPTTLAAALAAVVTPVGGLVALAVTDWWTALVVIAGTPLLVLLLRVFIRESGESTARYLQAQGEIAGLLTEAVRGVRTIAAAGTRDRDAARILAPLPELSRQGHLMWWIMGRSTARAAALLPLLQLAVLAVAGVRLAEGALSVGGMLAAWRYGVLATGTGVLVGQLNGLVRGRMAAGRLGEILETPEMMYGERELPPGEGTLELRGVRLSGLHNVDLMIPGGSVTAVVGRSGSGKSALAAVAGRLADPDAGTVLLDGVPVAGLSREVLRREVVHAFARPALLGGTVGGTIAFGAYEPGDEAVTEAARAACADDFVRRLPHGYATACAAAPLSGGEAQRLGLARAFAHAGRLLILDDATSSLDSATELKVSRALLHDVRARTRLIVAHRAPTAARADLVVWLEEGRVRAVAPHAELWQLPSYRAVFAEDAVDDAAAEEAVAEIAAGEKAVAEIAAGEKAVAEFAAGEKAVAEFAAGQEAVAEFAAGQEAVAEFAAGQEAVADG